MRENAFGKTPSALNAYNVREFAIMTAGSTFRIATATDTKIVRLSHFGNKGANKPGAETSWISDAR